MLIYQDQELAMKAMREDDMTPLEERYHELDAQMFLERETCDAGQYLRWHMEKMDILKILDGEKK